jgi:F-type H+-transporting ATPase subunit epsilon
LAEVSSKVTVLVESAERSDMIDLERAKRAKQWAEEKLTKLPLDDVEFEKARLALLRAVTRLNIVTKG